MPLLVFLHGLGQSPLVWQDQVTALPPGYRAVAPWLKGTRPARQEEFTVAGAADEVLRLLNVQGVEQMALCGASLGAVVALDAAVRAPGTISHLVLAAGQVATPKKALRAQQWALRATPAAKFAASGIDKKRFLATFDELARIDYRDRLGDVTAKTLVVCGADDRASLAASEELAAGIPDARLELIPDAGASPHSEQPQAFNDLLYSFLQEPAQAETEPHE